VEAGRRGGGDRRWGLRGGGAKIVGDAAALLGAADIVLCVRGPAENEVAAMREGAILVGLLNPHRKSALIEALAKAKVMAFAMEYVPRITRAQAMDALSSQANLAGYRSVIEAAEAYGRVLPMMMTPAGTIAPAKVFVMGPGSPACRRSPPPGAWGRSSPPPTCGRRRANRSNPWGPSSSPSRTRSSRRPRPPAATPRR